MSAIEAMAALERTRKALLEKFRAGLIKVSLEELDEWLTSFDQAMDVLRRNP